MCGVSHCLRGDLRGDLVENPQRIGRPYVRFVHLAPALAPAIACAQHNGVGRSGRHHNAAGVSGLLSLRRSDRMELGSLSGVAGITMPQGARAADKGEGRPPKGPTFPPCYLVAA